LAQDYLLKDVFINGVSGGKENTSVQEARRRDHISHFLLRLLACQTDTLKRWFIQKEVELLKYRLETEKSSLDLVKWLIYNNLNFEEVEMKEKTILLKQNKINFNNPKALVSNVFYKIPFEEALELVRTRRAFLQHGYCYCSSNEMITIISSKFRLELSRSLASLYNQLPQLAEHNRLLPIFEKIHNDLIKSKKPNRNTAEGNKEHITPDMIDELSVTSFPPCMRNTHELLRLNHHLKHYGRLHYGLFLKGIGLNLEDALIFFREEFIQKITPDKFQKEYSYNIRYNYGKEGKRVNLSAFSCAKIINGNAPGYGDSHGCPFRHFDTNNLTKMLKKHNIDDENIKEMVDLSKENKATSACSCYFSCKNKGVKIGEIYHPNQYFIESRKIAKGILPLPKQPDTNLDMPDDLDEFFEQISDQLQDNQLQKNANKPESNTNETEMNSKDIEMETDQIEMGESELNSKELVSNDDQIEMNSNQPESNLEVPENMQAESNDNLEEDVQPALSSN